MAQPVNPFFHRGPVGDATYFFGRTTALQFISELLSSGQSVSLSGPRRFGKTSLLFHLARPEISASYGLDPDTTRWVYMDGGMLDGLDADWFYGAVDRALGGEVDAVPYSRFVENMRSLAAKKQRLILALDEFELIAANPRFGTTLFNRLRGLAAQFPLQFITASRLPLGQLTFAHRETLSSPFFNIFAPVQLGLLSQPEATDLLLTLSTRHSRPFSPEIVTFLLDITGPHPLFVQIAGYRTFALLETGSALTAEMAHTIRSQVQADVEQHLLYYWHTLDDEAQYVLTTLPLLDALPPKKLAVSGLLANGQYLGTALQQFVQQQAVPGVLQSGPFLLDTQRGLAAAHNQRLHLTPTEFAAFKLFVQHSGQILTPEAIEAALWPDEVAPDPERARGVIKKLRAALGNAAAAIVNRRGQGWLLDIGR